MILEFPECKVTYSGDEYRGHISVTRSGRTCKQWDSVSMETLSNLSLNNSQENYCRQNPHLTESPAVPWCYVAGGAEAEWEECDIPLCKRKAA